MEENSVKCYLGEQIPFTLDVNVSIQEDGGIVVIGRSPKMVSWKVGNPKCVLENPNKSSLVQLSDQLKLALQKLELGCYINLSCRKPFDVKNGVYGTGKTEWSLALAFSKDLVTRLMEIFGEDAAFIQAEVVNWVEQEKHWARCGVVTKEFTTKEMKLTWPTENWNALLCRDDTLNPVIDTIVSSCTINANMNLVIIAKDSGPTEQERMNVHKRVLEEGLAPDTILIPENGTEVKCHRTFLVAQSDVFQTMFGGTEMQEAKIQRIEQPDMTEEGVRSFLAYLYHWDTTKAEESCSVAVELPKAAHKYKINFLEKSMRKLLLSKPDTWYEIDSAMKLFIFLYNMGDEWDLLKKKAVLVLKKNSFDLKNSKTVKQLFLDNPEAAIIFCQYGFSL